MPTLKWFTFNEAPRGSFSLPLTLPAGQEFFLTSIVMNGIQPGDRLVFNGTIGWSVNAVLPGVSELIIRIRLGSATGPVVFETRDSLFLTLNTGTIFGTQTTDITHAEISAVNMPTFETYFLNVRFESVVGTTRIEGPVHFSGSLISS
ncbi:hypothetical protein [Bacillus sp. EB600]|uniref:hypothetical protein n=1 Tax=Bacillus sp. EB600 TaxID=2806345 RepID=UPI0021088D88|nr:hypothetical protein [Bacillus sp. EB600]MCQ6282354.1 hypothetical protein [Bacillus sp. EB600]